MVTKDSPLFLEVLQRINPSITKEEFLSEFRGIKRVPEAQFEPATLFQYMIKEQMMKLEDKYDSATTDKYSDSNIVSLMQRRQIVNQFFHDNGLNVDVYTKGSRNLTMSSLDIEAALRELSYIASRID